jgi:hypothetical protein
MYSAPKLTSNVPISNLPMSSTSKRTILGEKNNSGDVYAPAIKKRTILGNIENSEHNFEGLQVKKARADPKASVSRSVYAQPLKPVKVTTLSVKNAVKEREKQNAKAFKSRTAAANRNIVQDSLNASVSSTTSLMSSGTRNKYKHIQSKVQSYAPQPSEVNERRDSHHSSFTSARPMEVKDNLMDMAELKAPAKHIVTVVRKGVVKQVNPTARRMLTTSTQLVPLVTLPKQMVPSPKKAPKASPKRSLMMRDPDVSAVNEYQEEILSYLFEIEVRHSNTD